MPEPWTGQAPFPSTRWSIVGRAADPEETIAKSALETLLRQYWHPIYSYVRWGWARTRQDAEDLVQEFFTAVMEKRTLGDADPSRGSFRGFLKGALRHFLLKQRERAAAQKRGGGRVAAELHPEDHEARATESSPEEAFDRAWVRRLLRDALGDLEKELEVESKLVYLRVLEAYDLSDSGKDHSYGEVAASLGLSESDVRNYLHVARARLRRAIRTRIQDTVADPEELEREIQELFG